MTLCLSVTLGRVALACSGWLSSVTLHATSAAVSHDAPIGASQRYEQFVRVTGELQLDGGSVTSSHALEGVGLRDHICACCAPAAHDRSEVAHAADYGARCPARV